MNYDATLQSMRKELIAWTQVLTNGRYTGRPKPIFSITLARILDAETKAPPGIQEFVRSNADVTAATWAEPVPVTQLALVRESRWMMTAAQEFPPGLPLGMSASILEELERW